MDTPLKQDILNLNIQDIITHSSKIASEYLEIEFFKHANTVSSDSEKKALIFIASILNFSFDLDNPKNPFEKPQNVMDGKRSLIISDLTEEQIHLIAEVYPQFSNHEIRARFADVLWVLRKDACAARTAVSAYLESAKALESPAEWTTPFKRIKRASQVALMLGKSNPLQQQVNDYIKKLLDRLAGQDPLFFSGKLMELLLDIDCSEPEKYASLAKQMAEKAEQEKDFNKAKYYYEVSSKWCKKNSDSTSQDEALHGAAEALVKEAELAENESFRGPLVSAHFINEAIQYYRGLPGSEEIKTRISELRKKLELYQSESVKQMKAVGTRVDLTPYVKQAREAVSGKDITEALTSLANITQSPAVEVLRKQAEKSIQENPMSFIMGASILDKTGHVIANKPSYHSGKPEERERAVRVQMYWHLRMHQNLTAFGFIKPAMEKILSEHEVNKGNITALIHGMPFVPQEREQIFVEGILAGFNSNFLTSTHLLIPQIENSIRYLLYARGVLPHGHDDEGIQEEYNLNKLLYMPEVKDILGEDLTFDLQGLLVEKYCSNLRNDMAHGLKDFDDFNSAPVLYLWWITIMLILNTR